MLPIEEHRVIDCITLGLHNAIDTEMQRFGSMDAHLNCIMGSSIKIVTNHTIHYCQFLIREINRFAGSFTDCFSCQFSPSLSNTTSRRKRTFANRNVIGKCILEGSRSGDFCSILITHIL